MRGTASKKLCLAVLFVLLVFVPSGCGVDLLDEESRELPAAPAADSYDFSGAEAVSSTKCYLCHSDAAEPASLETVFGDSDVDGWLDGPHGNYEGSDHQDHGADNDGFPDYGYFYDETCDGCHDKRGDGETIAAFYAETGIDSLGRVDRPIIGCEGCHGSAEDHSAVGAAPVQYAAPDPEVCGSCHNDNIPDSHLPRHPEADRIYEDYAASPHASSTKSKGKCSKCHTDEGAKLYKDVSGGHDELSDALSSAPTVEDATVVQCRTCHDAHNPDTLLKAATASNSAEYETCTNCHQTEDSYHGENSGRRWSGGLIGDGNFDSSGIIYDTHVDNATTEWIEGYVLDTSSDRVCRDCHNVHSSDNTINEQWAKSAHGGHILEVKETAFLNTSDADPDVAKQNALDVLNGTDPYGSVMPDVSTWSHYNWKTQYSGRCSKCKTSSAFKSFVNSPWSKDYETASYTATGQQRELLYCWACHTDSAGGLRDSYSFLNTAEYDEPAGRIANVPDLSGSNLCMVCHSGRKSGEQIASFVYNASQVYDNTAFTDVYPHVTPAGGMVFKTIGYEFDSRSYAGWFPHDSIGADSNGPCVGCHMNHDEGHTFEAVEKDSVTGRITDITAFEQTCWNFACHSGIIKSDIEDLRVGYEAAVGALNEALKYGDAGTGFTYTGSRPYFGTNPSPVKIWNGIYSAEDPTGKNNLGVAFNLYMLLHEDGAYVHNSRYARRLVFDSIDWIEDGSLDSKLSGPVVSNSAAIRWLGIYRQ